MVEIAELKRAVDKARLRAIDVQRDLRHRDLEIIKIEEMKRAADHAVRHDVETHRALARKLEAVAENLKATVKAGKLTDSAARAKLTEFLKKAKSAEKLGKKVAPRRRRRQIR